MDFNITSPSICSHNNTTPLIYYYYDDDWGIYGSNVWYRGSDGKRHEGQLTACLSCGTVFVKENDNNIK